ncbi:UDP-glucuronic acid decarboxylase family protein [Ottowia thiooxydans]|uniref:UDP-glucuronic acid decarboxylase family protein n=1 Tax=Ottowia thiooxydans TaxID=219182 RepID=UPI000402636A|nr:UDP-glucuronic acid decarboxylase family protein [Ottowia thiooxydans]
MTTNSERRILVTGGGGFIGSHLCQRLIDSGHSVLCVDNFVSSVPSNIAALLDHPQFELIQQDVALPLDVQVHQIYNLACPASPIQYQRDAVQTIRTNVAGAMNVLELAKATGARVLQASTSEIYGDPAVHPQPESYWGHVNPIGVRACYDEGKRCAEALFFAYHHQFSIDIKVVRIFNTYGPRTQLNDGRVISNFIVQALRGEDITIYGDGSQTRSFCYVDDMVSGLIAMMNSEPGFTGPVNLGNPEELSILELAQVLRKQTDSHSQLVFKALPQDDPRQRMPEIELARQRLGWYPTTPLVVGLERTIDYFRRELAAASKETTSTTITA